MEKWFEEIRQFAARDDQSRRSMIMALRDLANSLETTNDTIHRYGHMVCDKTIPISLQRNVPARLTIHFLQNLQSAIVKIGIDLGLFKLLSQSSSPLSVEELSPNLDIDPVLASELTVKYDRMLPVQCILTMPCVRVLRTYHSIPRFHWCRSRSGHKPIHCKPCHQKSF